MFILFLDDDDDSIDIDDVHISNVESNVVVMKMRGRWILFENLDL